LHFDAGAITGLNDGDTVSTWHDLSGNGYDGTNVGNPSYHTNMIAGKPAVYLDGDDSFSTSLATVQDMTVFVVTKGSVYHSLIRWQTGGFMVYPYNGTLIESNNDYPGTITCGFVNNQ